LFVRKTKTNNEGRVVKRHEIFSTRNIAVAGC